MSGKRIVVGSTITLSIGPMELGEFSTVALVHLVNLKTGAATRLLKQDLCELAPDTYELTEQFLDDVDAHDPRRLRAFGCRLDGATGIYHLL